jgi:hypothetical protein
MSAVSSMKFPDAMGSLIGSPALLPLFLATRADVRFAFIGSPDHHLNDAAAAARFAASESERSASDLFFNGPVRLRKKNLDVQQRSLADYSQEF